MTIALTVKALDGIVLASDCLIHHPSGRRFPKPKIHGYFYDPEQKDIQNQEHS